MTAAIRPKSRKTPFAGFTLPLAAARPSHVPMPTAAALQASFHPQRGIAFFWATLCGGEVSCLAIKGGKDKCVLTSLLTIMFCWMYSRDGKNNFFCMFL